MIRSPLVDFRTRIVYCPPLKIGLATALLLMSGLSWIFQGVFVDDGSETHFTLSSGVACYIKNVSSGKKKEGIIHSLVINDNEIPEAVE